MDAPIQLNMPLPRVPGHAVYWPASVVNQELTPQEACRQTRLATLLWHHRLFPLPLATWTRLLARALLRTVRRLRDSNRPNRKRDAAITSIKWRNVADGRYRFG
jgi:hypothetical protein